MNTELEKREETVPTRTQPTYRRPYYTVNGNKDAYTVSVFMPGVSKDNYTLTVDRDDLLVEGRKEIALPEKARYLHREIAVDSYRLRLQLNVSIDPEKITAKSEEGVLTIHLPIAQEAKPKTIRIG